MKYIHETNVTPTLTPNDARKTCHFLFHTAACHAIRQCSANLRLMGFQRGGAGWGAPFVIDSQAVMDGKHSALVTLGVTAVRGGNRKTGWPIFKWPFVV